MHKYLGKIQNEVVGCFPLYIRANTISSNMWNPRSMALVIRLTHACCIAATNRMPGIAINHFANSCTVLVVLGEFKHTHTHKLTTC